MHCTTSTMLAIRLPRCIIVPSLSLSAATGYWCNVTSCAVGFWQPTRRL